MATADVLAEAACAVLAVAALALDLARGRIPDVLTIPAILLGLVLGLAGAGLTGLLEHGYGLLAGLTLLLPFTLLHDRAGRTWIGGGDVKFLAAVGALTGWVFVLSAAFLGGLLGLVVALVYVARGRRRFRYGTTLAAGTLAALVLRHATNLIPT